MSNLTVSGGSDFWGEMTNEDFAIPQVSIGQPTSTKDGAKPGHFIYNTGLALEKIEGCTLVDPGKARIFFGGTGTKRGRARCASDNFYVPAPRIKNPVSVNCLTCPAAQWGVDDPIKNKLALEVGHKHPQNAPLCNETYRLLVADSENKMFFLTLKSTALKVVREKLFSRIRNEFGGYPPFGVSFDLSLEKIKSDNGVYYIPAFDNFKPLTEEATGHRFMLNQTYGGKKAAQILGKQHEAADEAYDQSPFPSDDPA